MRVRRAARTAVSLALALAVSGCAEFPVPPEQLPATFIPEVEPSAYDLQDIVIAPPSELELATYMVVTMSCGESWQGTGFAVGPHTVVTNRHVVEGLTQYENLVTLEGLTSTITATATAVATFADLAIITTASSDELLHTVPLALDDPEVADEVVTIGYPGGQPQRTHVGVIVNYTTYDAFPGIPILRSNADIAAGASGSPIFNTRGEVVGVEYAEDGVGYGLAMPVSALRAFLDDETRHEDLRASCDA